METICKRLWLIAGVCCGLSACEDSLAGNSQHALAGNSQRAQSQHTTQPPGRSSPLPSSRAPNSQRVQPQQVASQTTVLKIGCKPASDVFIDGEYKGLSPLKVDVMPGTYEVQFVHPEKGKFTREVTVTADLEFMLMHQWP